MSTQITNVKARPQELLRQIGPEMYRAAYEKGLSLSGYLEVYEDPSEGYNDGTDAFQRLLKAAGIRTWGVEEIGLPASTYEEFTATDQLRALVPEWIARLHRRVKVGAPYSTRGIYTSGDSTPGSWEAPYSDAASGRWSQLIAPAIPVSELVALSTGIDGDAYRAFYLTHDADETSMTRVGEGAEIPRVKLQSGENIINLHKFGRVLEATYEQLRRQRLDKIALHIQRMAVMAEVDKVETILGVMVSGDGNSGTAATSHTLASLDSSASSLTLKAWLAFKMKFANPYMVTGAIAREDVVLDMLLLNVGSANVPLVNIQGPAGFGTFTQINGGLADGVRVGWTSAAPASKIVAFDRRFAIERVYETGADISEVERFTTRQTQTLTLTEVEGYAVIDGNATRVLDLS